MTDQPHPRPSMPAKFNWRPMRANMDYPWLYEVSCKVCKWNKLSDYENVIDWAMVHDCAPRRTWK